MYLGSQCITKLKDVESGSLSNSHILKARHVAESNDIGSDISFYPHVRSTYTWVRCITKLKDDEFNNSPDPFVLELNVKLSPKTLGYHPTFFLFKHEFR